MEALESEQKRREVEKSLRQKFRKLRRQSGINTTLMLAATAGHGTRKEEEEKTGEENGREGRRRGMGSGEEEGKEEEEEQGKRKGREEESKRKRKRNEEEKCKRKRKRKEEEEGKEQEEVGRNDSSLACCFIFLTLPPLFCRHCGRAACRHRGNRAREGSTESRKAPTAAGKTEAEEEWNFL